MFLSAGGGVWHPLALARSRDSRDACYWFSAAPMTHACPLLLPDPTLNSSTFYQTDDNIAAAPPGAAPAAPRGGASQEGAPRPLPLRQDGGSVTAAPHRCVSLRRRLLRPSPARL